MRATINALWLFVKSMITPSVAAQGASPQAIRL